MVSQSDFINASDRLRKDLFAVLDELFFFLVNDYNQEILALIDVLMAEMDISKEEEEAIFPQLVWWGTFCSPIGFEQKTIYQIYLQKNKYKLKKKSRKMQEVLVSWLQLNPGFYYVIDAEDEEACIYYLSDVFEGEIKRLSIQNELFQLPESGEILTGLLLPMGDDSYATLSGFYHIPKQLTQKLVKEIIPYFERYAVSPNYKFNPHLYPALIKCTLHMITESAGDPHYESLSSDSK